MNDQNKWAKLTVKRKTNTGEWVVRVSINGEHRPELTYFTDDKTDALDTRRHMENRLKNQNYRIV